MIEMTNDRKKKLIRVSITILVLALVLSGFIMAYLLWEGPQEAKKQYYYRMMQWALKQLQDTAMVKTLFEFYPLKMAQSWIAQA